MAFRQGRFTEITVSGVAIGPYCDTADFSRDIDLMETTTFTKTAKTYLTGLQDGKFTIKGKYDPTAGGPVILLSSLVGSSTSVPINYYPGGAVAGQTVRQFNAYLTSYKESSPVADVVGFSADFTMDGVVTASGL